jgi:putative SOS response-associated peptidase YedK
MCSLYSLTKGQAAIRDWFRAKHDRTGNLPLFPGIFPDQMAPIVRADAAGERELVMARWGMPGPPHYGGAPVTNIRNLSSPHWRGWLGLGNRRNGALLDLTDSQDSHRVSPIERAYHERHRAFPIISNR